MFKFRSHFVPFVFLASTSLPGIFGCSGTGNAPDTDLSGSVRLAITATTAVGSVKVDFKGATRDVTRCVRVDGTTTTLLQALPTNSVDVSAVAYSDGTCDGDAIWLAESQTVQLLPGQPTSIQLVFHPNGIAQISTNFIEDLLPSNCGINLSRVPREAMAQDATGPAGTGLHAVYDDGDVRDEGPIDFGPYEAGNVPSYYPADVLADSSAPALWQTIWGLGSETLTGFIVGPRNGSVTFGISADDYASLDLGNGLLSIAVTSPGYVSGSAVLQAGVYYPITLHYANQAGSNWFRFYWQCPTQ